MGPLYASNAVKISVDSYARLALNSGHLIQ